MYSSWSLDLTVPLIPRCRIVLLYLLYQMRVTFGQKNEFTTEKSFSGLGLKLSRWSQRTGRLANLCNLLCSSALDTLHRTLPTCSYPSSRPAGEKCFAPVMAARSGGNRTRLRRRHPCASPIWPPVPPPRV